jgi:ribonuclease D
MSPPDDNPAVIASDDEMRGLLLERAGSESPLAVDLEASGMFAYRARVCTLQLAWGAYPRRRIVVVDALAVAIASLRETLGRSGPLKIVHDVAFDARLLAESGIELGNVHDTALAAHMLGRKATGLAALLELELGVQIKKDLQHHDWRVRPLEPATLAYLASDVAHLESLERVLWNRVSELGIEAEVLEETEYRLDSAMAAARAPQEEPAYLRIRGITQLAQRELAVLRAVAELREHEAQLRDVPPYKVAPNEALVAIARSRPATPTEVSRIRSISTSTPEARAFASAIARAVGSSGDSLPEAERSHFERVRTPPAIARSRREREARLVAWRHVEANQRAVNEQVVLPGHCLKDAVGEDEPTLAALSRVRGIGAFRIERDGPAIVRALRGEGRGG